MVRRPSTMNSLILEYNNANEHVFDLSIESFCGILLWKYLNTQDYAIVKLVKSLKPFTPSVPVNFIEIHHEILNDSIHSRLPELVLDYESHHVVGLCSVLRGICGLSKTSNLLAAQLLGFKENCLMAPSEVSLWTSFCERDIIACAKRLICATDEVSFPIELQKFERDLSNPVRIHNVYKVAREVKNDRSIKSGTTLDLEHKYCHGNEVNLSDFILFAIYKLMFIYALDIESISTMIPLTIKWYRTMEMNENNLCNIFANLTIDHPCGPCGHVDVKGSGLQINNDIAELNTDGKYFSLLKRQLTGYKYKNRKIFTDQKMIDEALKKLKSLNLDIKSCPGDSDHSSIDDDFVNELLTCGKLPVERLERKKAQLKSIANEVLKIARPKDVIVDFCSGTGHLGFLIAKLLPQCKIFILENKEESINRAKLTAQKLQLSNVIFFQCNLEYFNESFSIGVSLHACGVATDLVLAKCWKVSANFVCSPCCYGKIQDLGILPQSEKFREALTAKDLINIGHCSDQTHDASNVKHLNVEKSIQGYFCMDIIDTDRLLRATELDYNVKLTRLYPENCTLKNRLIVGIFSRHIH